MTTYRVQANKDQVEKQPEINTGYLWVQVVIGATDKLSMNRICVEFDTDVTPRAKTKALDLYNLLREKKLVAGKNWID